MTAERLQKIMARGGVASRRACEELISAGRVRVNGKIVTELGATADARRDKIELDGKLVLRESFVYAVLQKPRGYMSTLSDPEGRPTILELLKKLDGRVFPVGRLDFATSGVLLITNDGDFSNALTHPSKRVPKTYVVKVQGEMAERDMELWRKGIQLEDGITQPAELVFDRYEDKKTWFELTIYEGRNQQIRRMGEATGFEVMRLSRLSFAGISGEKLKPGAVRHLSYRELVDLKKVFGVPRKTAASGLDLEDAMALKKPVKLRSNKDNPNAGIESRDTNRFGAERDARGSVGGREHTARGPRPGAKNDGSRTESRVAAGGGRSDRGPARESRGPRADSGARGDRGTSAPSRAPRAPAEGRSDRGTFAPTRAPSAPARAERAARGETAGSAAPAARQRPLYRGGAKKDDTGVRDERAPARPRVTKPGPSRGGGSDAPRSPRSDAPRSPRSDAPRSPRSDAPRSPRSDAPRSPRSDAPRSPRGDAPRSPRSDAPRSPRGDVPRSPRADAPRSPRSDAPRSPRSDAPRGGAGRSDAPRAPRGPRADKPVSAGRSGARGRTPAPPPASNAHKGRGKTRGR